MRLLNKTKYFIVVDETSPALKAIQSILHEKNLRFRNKIRCVCGTISITYANYDYQPKECPACLSTSINILK